MNGALRANINAVLAHVRNGNTNGPVGQMAALAVADANAEGAAEFLDSAGAQELGALSQALADAGYESLAEYEAAVAADPANAIPEVEDALAGIGMDALDRALADAGYADLGEYETAVAADPANTDPEIDAALAGLGVVDDTSLAELAEAEQALQALQDAEKSILATWNKNGDPDPDTISPEEQELLDALYQRLDGNEAEILAAIPTEVAAE